ncbi:proteasome maturation factor UMP1-domain-containing protein [Gorgonomyces haynaldii]|nr:proteasome maturation factor UMP1-domain-containing protein [Gorgonomyces haynaldii]
MPHLVDSARQKDLSKMTSASQSHLALRFALFQRETLVMSLRIVPESLPKGRKQVGSGEYGVHDTLREGFKSVRSEIVAGHELEHRLQEWDKTQLDLKLKLARDMFGLSMPLQLQMERTLVGFPRGIAKHNLGMEILSGSDSIEFEDFLGTETFDLVDHRQMLEDQYLH